MTSSSLKISSPEDLRALPLHALDQVAKDLRDELISTVSSSGGHFASSLGATEITVACHYCFNTPNDRLIFDVGHQAYIHKILTGRRTQMGRIRQKDGISGFLRRDESPYDAFGAGHAGTSISAAVGMAVALSKTQPERFVVPIIGDGSITAGMAFEALNHAGALGLKNLIVILNDNEMSISPNVGAMSWLFSKVVTSKASTLARKRFKNWYENGYVPGILYKTIDRAEEAAQGFINEATTVFAGFGFRYIGPVDGHNVQDLVEAIEHAKTQEVPVIIHAYTEKGKGYEPAEEDPLKWHGVTPFDPAKGMFLAKKSSPPPPSYTNIFAEALVELAKEDEKIVGITAAMPTGTGLDALARECPEQFFDVGICGQHAVTFAAGLACEGQRPVCAIYSTFLQRAYDQVVHDVCIQNLPVVFAMDRAGVVGNDGETHQGVFDISFLRSLPNMVIMAPKDEQELRDMLFTGLKHSGPIALRYPRGNAIGVALRPGFQTLPIGKAEVLEKGKDILLLALGPCVQTALEVSAFVKKELGLSLTVVNVRFAKPLDEALLLQEIPRHAVLATLEDHSLAGGFSSAVSELIHDKALELPGAFLRFGVGDSFVPHASQDEQKALHGYDTNSICQILRKVFVQEDGKRVAY